MEQIFHSGLRALYATAYCIPAARHALDVVPKWACAISVGHKEIFHSGCLCLMAHPNHHRAILALRTALWDASLRDDAAARAWLDGSGPASVLEANDGWQRKIGERV